MTTTPLDPAPANRPANTPANTPADAPVPPPAAIWQRPISVELLAASNANSAVSHLGIEFTQVGPDFIRARVPVDRRTVQPYGLLHGGVSVVLAETLGSCGAAWCVAPGHRVVGLDINANHVRSVSSGWVTGTARPVHVGRTTQVWQIELHDDAGKLVCVSRITMAVLGRAVSAPTKSAGVGNSP